jgi:hypothetical protein
MILGEITAVHLVGDQYFPLKCFCSRQATAIGDQSGRYRLFRQHYPISSFEHDLASVFFQTGALQQSAQSHTGPFCIPDCAEFPLGSLNLGNEEDPTIASALQDRDARLGRHVSQFLVGQRKRIPDRTIDAQLVRGEL